MKAPGRDLDVSWRTFSLTVKNGGAGNIPEQFREGAMASHRALRVAEAVRAKDPAGVGPL